jgi:hypothetical protein
MTLGFMALAFVCIIKGYTGSLPWLTAMVTLPWTAYGVSQVYYYKKATVENSKNGIKYDAVMMASLNQTKPFVAGEVEEESIDINYGV